ncbi:MAG: hypothetical protein DMG36_14145, partial [Acidobacteria bacterium]
MLARRDKQVRACGRSTTLPRLKTRKARKHPGDQRRALQECFPHHRNASAVLKDKRAEAVTVRELRGWIAREIHLDLTNAPFDRQDEKLLPSAGACSRCPRQTGSNPLLFPEIPR